ncbi:MAG TPA: hypothetical protein VEK79_14070 [Thermoanaerobaculia bacterium]|nr:hypothetical protein [Thermoanaerobaculia bacterium]
MTLPTILMTACTSLSAITVALLAFQLIRKKRDVRQELDAAKRIGTAIDELEEAIHGASVLTASELLPIVNGLDMLREDFEKVARSVEELTSRPPQPAIDRVTLERQVLVESWKQFRANPDLSAAFDEAMEDRAWGELLDALKNVVPADLKPTFDSVIVPCREHRTLVQKMDLISRVVGGKIPRLETDAEEVFRTRELATLLTSDAASRLQFRFKSWVTDSFLPFADLYLQRYQQAQLEKRAEELQAGVGLVRQVLQIAAVEPIEVTPGETPFDSMRHIGRSTSNDPRFPDGVITGVVRNGFIEGGLLVLRQPEVIVNRMR